MNRIPKKIFVFICANMSNPFESLRAKICVVMKIDATKIRKSFYGKKYQKK